MELMLDTVNLKELEYALEAFPIVGVTSNPSIFRDEGNIDFFDHLKKVKKLVGPKRSLHVQVTTDNARDMIQEAKKIRNRVGEDTYIKIPVSEEGVKAIKYLAGEGCFITATAIYTTFQGVMAILAGAQYAAVYYNRMQNIDVNPDQVISDLAALINRNGHNCKILAASFKNVGQVTSALIHGSHSVTIPVALLTTGLSVPSIQKAVDDFEKDWEQIHGPNASILTLP